MQGPPPRSADTAEEPARTWRDMLGPGLITGASDDDPSGIATYAQAGARFGFQLSWTLLITYPLMVAIQAISARIGRTTGRGIAGNLRRHHPPWVLQGTAALLCLANTINIGADLGAMAASMRLLTHVHLAALVDRRRLLADGGRHSRHDHQPVSAVLAGVRGGGGRA